MENTVSLQEFVKETLLQIQRAISDARNNCDESVMVIGPAIRTVEVLANDNSEDLAPAIERINFDLCVTIEKRIGSGDSAKLGGGLKIGIFSANAGVEGMSQEHRTNNAVQRVKFSIPVAIKGREVNAMSGERKKKDLTYASD